MFVTQCSEEDNQRSNGEINFSISKDQEAISRFWNRGIKNARFSKPASNQYNSMHSSSTFQSQSVKFRTRQSMIRVKTTGCLSKSVRNRKTLIAQRICLRVQPKCINISTGCGTFCSIDKIGENTFPARLIELYTWKLRIQAVKMELSSEDEKLVIKLYCQDTINSKVRREFLTVTNIEKRASKSFKKIFS